MAVITTEKLGATVGAEVKGVDKDRLLHDDELPAACLEALEANGALVFRDLHIDDATQVAFSRKLGEVEVFGKGEYPEIFLITLDPKKNPSAAYLRGTFDWHIDGCTPSKDVPPIKASLLTAHAVAEKGGETEFASTYAAYEDLDDDEKEWLDTLRVMHALEASQRLVTPDPTPEQLAGWRRQPPREHPLVWKHNSGRRSLVLGASTLNVVGMSPEDGRKLLDDLLERSTAPERVYRHEWEVGDTVIWDNRGVLHRAEPYDPASRREMLRTTLLGDEPIQ
jgi:alpha-ketoglutarate-dependent taurine dioxygenase